MIYAAHTYARTYASIVNWIIEAHSVAVDESQQEVRDILAKMSASSINTVWNYVFELQSIIETEKNRPKDTPAAKWNLTLQIGDDVINRFKAAIDRYKAYVLKMQQ